MWAGAQPSPGVGPGQQNPQPHLSSGGESGGKDLDFGSAPAEEQDSHLTLEMEEPGQPPWWSQSSTKDLSEEHLSP